MEKPDIVFRTKKSLSNYIWSVFFFSISLCLFLIKANYFIIAVPFFFATVVAFHDEISIIVYNDKFCIQHSNVFGKIMSINLFYYYKEITSFEVNTTQKWKANFSETIVSTVIGMFLPGNNGRLSEDSKTSLFFVVKNQLGETKTINLHLGFTRGDFLKALELIKRKMPSNIR